MRAWAGRQPGVIGRYGLEDRSMAKMFYTLEEAAARLKLTEEQVREMAASGQVQEFRDRDRLMFKREQIDLLSTGQEDDVIPLADAGSSGLGLSMDPGASGGGSGSGPGIGIDDASEKSGISIFDTDDTEEADPSAVTRITETAAGTEFAGGSMGSGSGLLELTREGDDTSLGADFLGDVYQDAEGVGETQGASGLFETTGAASDMSPGFAGSGVMAMVPAEAYDGKGSGLVGGFALGAIAVLAVALVVVVTGMLGTGESPIVKMFAGNFVMYAGIMAAVVVVPGILGWVLAKKG